MKGKQQDFERKSIRYGIHQYSFGAGIGSDCGWTNVFGKWSSFSY